MAQSLTTPDLLLSDIVVEGRIRADLGDIEELAASIKSIGLLQPIVVEQDLASNRFFLRNGGRRFSAYTLLNHNKVPGFDRIPVRVFSEMPEHQRVKIELEENIRRKDMTWQEKTVAIVKYHKASKRAALLDGETWSQQMTGELLNLNQAAVSIAFTVYEAIQKGNEKVAGAESLTEAIKVLASENLDQAQAEQMRRINLKRAETARVQSEATNSLPKVSTSILVQSRREGTPETVVDKVQFTKEQIADFYHEGNCIELLPRLKERYAINHIICDPPYGIDMSNLVMQGVERVEETHQVEDNLKLLPEFLRVAFDCIQEDGFLCMWYDLDHHEKIHAWATKIGWRVQRWPLVWCKTSTCRNSQAQYNITKSTEVCYFMRRSEKSILKVKQSRNYALADSVAGASHPFVKPHELWDLLVNAVASSGQTVVDPFAGEGSSLVSFFKAGCNPVGIEVDPKHIASGLSYIQEALNKKNILDDILTEAPI